MCPPTCQETQGEAQLLLRRSSGRERLPGRPQGAAAHILFPVRMIFEKKEGAFEQIEEEKEEEEEAGGRTGMETRHG